MQMENKLITRDVVFQIREITPEMKEKRQAEFIISSESKDTYETVFVASGADFQRYNANPIVAYGHRTFSDDPDMILGTSEVFQEGNLTVGRVFFEDAETNPTAEKVWRKVLAGTLRMASVGARVLEWRYGDETKGEDKNVLYFTRWELLEWSIVPIGSNPDALKREAQTIEEIRSEMIKKIPVIEPENVSYYKRNLREKEFELLNNNK
jgi:hypothetical protein